MKDRSSIYRFRTSAFWMRCFAVVLVLGGFGGVKLANATDSSDIQIEKTVSSKTAIEKTQSDQRTASSSKIAPEKAPVDSTIRDVAWLKPVTESRRPAKSSSSTLPHPTVSELRQTALTATSKAEFLRQQPQNSAQKLLAEAPIRDSTIAQATSSQDTDDLRRQLVIDPLVELRIPAYSPGSSVGVPTAFGANFGDAFVGLSFSNRRPRINEADGALSAGFGLGDSERALGLEISANIGSLRRFGRNGDLGFKLHRSLPGKAAIAVGFDSGIVWGEENETTVSTLYGVATKVFDLRPGNVEDSLPLTLTLGIGGGRFRSFENIQNGRGGVGVFASAGLRVVPQASVIGSWTGQDLNLGVSYVPLKTTPLFLTFVVGNVLSRNDNATLFSFGIGYGFNYTGYQY